MQKIGIGYENYKEFFDKNMYYVDKTLLIRDVIEKGGKVTLFTRPRRFGKTLALSMLRTFFETEYDLSGNPVDNSRYFKGMKIMGADHGILSMMGQHPVIKLTLKSAKQPDFRNAVLQLRNDIVSEIDRHGYLEDSAALSSNDLQQLQQLLTPKHIDNIEAEKDFQAEIGRYATALRSLSDWLYKHHGKNVVVLLDEYDVPLENAFLRGFYGEMVGFIRSLFESVLKTNDHLELAVVTGCLRISKESIFTGLNHLVINSIRDENFAESFGFTEGETEAMLRAYGMEDRIPEAKAWYDGYLFGTEEIYNPWSIISYVYSVVIKGRQFAEPQWANTSSNDIIKEMVWNADDEMKWDLTTLIEGGAIEKRIHEDITYDDIHESEDNLWNFLYFTGYMKKVSERTEGEDVYVSMCIPNKEIRSIYRHQIQGWFEKQVKDADRKAFHKAILEQDTDGIADYVSDLLSKCISTFDSSEAFYHGYLLSLLYGVPGYLPQSNREEGEGRPDIVLYPDKWRDPAIIIEIKVVKQYNRMEGGIREAFDQIRDRKYEEGILEDGYMGVYSYGFCFCRKGCIVRKYEE